MFFSLETEGLYPENVPVRLPYHKPTPVVGFAVAVPTPENRDVIHLCLGLFVV